MPSVMVSATTSVVASDTPAFSRPLVMRASVRSTKLSPVRALEATQKAARSGDTMSSDAASKEERLSRIREIASVPE